MYLQDFHNSAPLETQNFTKVHPNFHDFEEMLTNVCKVSKITMSFHKFREMLDNVLQHFDVRAVQKYSNRVDLEKC